MTRVLLLIAVTVVTFALMAAAPSIAPAQAQNWSTYKTPPAYAQKPAKAPKSLRGRTVYSPQGQVYFDKNGDYIRNGRKIGAWHSEKKFADGRLRVCIKMDVGRSGCLTFDFVYGWATKSTRGGFKFWL